MKIQKSIALALTLIFVSFYSCDELDELTDFDINEDFNTTINVSVSEDSEGNPATLNETATISITSNQDIQDNLDLIQDVTINSLTFKIDNYVGAEEVTVTSATLNFGDTTIAVADIELKTSDDNNTVYNIAEASQLNAIGNYLESNPTLTITLTGTISSTPAEFDVIVNLDTTVTIDAI